MSDENGADLKNLILGIDHIGIAVPDLGTGRALFEGIFGLHEYHTEVNESQGVSESMIAFPDEGAQIQLLAPSARKPQLESFWPIKVPAFSS